MSHQSSGTPRETQDGRGQDTPAALSLTKFLLAPPDDTALLVDPEQEAAEAQRHVWERAATKGDPPLVRAERRLDPLIPVVKVHEHPAREGGRLAFGGIVGPDRQPPSQLPLFATGDQGPRVSLLELQDRRGVPTMSRGRGAPLDLRLAVAACILTPYVARSARGRLVVTVRELRDFLFPNGWRRLRDWPRVLEALRRVGLYTIPDGHGGRWYPVRLVRDPGDDPELGQAVLIDVELPPGSAAGPPIDRRELARRGVGSGPGFRAYIAAHTVTWLPGKTRVVIPHSKYRTWARNLDAYPVLTRGDRRRLAFGAKDQGKRTVARIDSPWEDLPGIEIVDRRAIDRDGRRGWRIVPTAAAAVRQPGEGKRPNRIPKAT